MPWTATSFAKHNKQATVTQLQAAAQRANEVLDTTGDEGAAVRAGNALIKHMLGKKGKD